MNRKFFLYRADGTDLEEVPGLKEDIGDNTNEEDKGVRTDDEQEADKGKDGEDEQGDEDEVLHGIGSGLERSGKVL